MSARGSPFQISSQQQKDQKGSSKRMAGGKGLEGETSGAELVLPGRHSGFGRPERRPER